jgi:hypothetical protein
VVILNCKTNNENTFCGDIVLDNANIIPILLGAASLEVVAMWMVLMVKGEGVRFEGSGTRGGATCVGEGRVDGMACDSDSAQAGGDAMVGSDTGGSDTGSGDTGSLGKCRRVW